MDRHRGGRSRNRQELERDRHAEREIVGAKDLAHPAPAESSRAPIRYRSSSTRPGGKRLWSMDVLDDVPTGE
ncbi:MAG: hypothetical protein ACYSUF_04710 [Planctomycetota bacterium]